MQNTFQYYTLTYPTSTDLFRRTIPRMNFESGDHSAQSTRSEQNNLHSDFCDRVSMTMI